MSDQIILSSTLIALLCLFIWGKVRYDALAVGALFILVVLEIIPANEAFAGFAHPAVICLLYTSPSPRDKCRSRMPSSA